jgi:hypothetical protein
MSVGAFVLALVAAAQQSSVVSTMPGANEVFLWGQGLVDGRNFDYVVTNDAMAKVPEWMPDKQDPPLKISRAIELAKQAAKGDHSDFTDLLLESIQMRPSSSADHQDRWFYIVGMYPFVGGKLSVHTEVTVVILMDGTVVKPTEKPRRSP